ncbi:hypothetical protein [Streptomyces sp. NPDC004286]|uniref:hypothetical protein n=1 Tax=Streptomyces sp. NPDC004286 TaxID=3364696 RepID=UPI00367516DB
MKRRSTKPVEKWLLAAALDQKRARKDWSHGGLALLRSGRRFVVVSLPTTLIGTATNTLSVPAQDAYLTRTLPGTPVIRSRDGREVHALLPPGTLARWDAPGTECLGADHFLGVPRPDLVGHPGWSTPYWVVPMARPGALGCEPAVARLIARGRTRMAQQEGTP